LYVGWLGQHLELVRRLPHGERWMLLLLLGTFATDTGAYAVGRLIGKHKLAPRVSPAKTVEGAIGGIAFAIGAVVALDYLLALPHDPVRFVALGMAIAVAAEAGDLAESAVKRRLGVKDMGRLFPGHGGVLDRLDSVLFVGAVVYYVVKWVII
jgi:phosphatidate cytidylyltransferase